MNTAVDELKVEIALVQQKIVTLLVKHGFYSEAIFVQTHSQPCTPLILPSESDNAALATQNTILGYLTEELDLLMQLESKESSWQDWSIWLLIGAIAIGIIISSLYFDMGLKF